jgi:hypothetical protein|tara:strand:- start:1008 stop:1355 length:348 start_codon:yes stop_codon:yes gene_type:complete
MTDLRLEKALEFANYRSTLSVQQKQLREQCEARLNFAFNGGLFKIDQNLISFVGNFLKEDKKSMVILDSNQTPIDLEDLQKFYEDINTRWFEAVNDYHRQYQELSTKRKVTKLVE